MNPIIESLWKRKSVRAYTGQQISEEDKRLILQSASEAASAGNQQMYTILDITDQNLKDTLSETCDHQPFIAKAEMVLVFCVDFQKWYDAFSMAGCNPRHPQAGDFMLAAMDAAIAAQNAVTAAESLGIGSCYIGDIMERYEIHGELFGLPNYAVPILMAVFGYPTEQQKERKKPLRAPLDFLVHENHYRRLAGEELRNGIAPNRGDMDFEEWMKRFCSRKYHSGFSLEMSRSIQAALDHFCGRDQNKDSEISGNSETPGNGKPSETL